MNRFKENRLYQFRIYLGLSQSELAEKIGMKQGSIGDIERGKINMSARLIEKLIPLGFNPSCIYDAAAPLAKNIQPICDHIVEANEMVIYKNAKPFPYFSIAAQNGKND